MSRSLLAVLAACSLSLSGCGTFSDAMCGPITDQVYYRGVSFDIGAVVEGVPLAAADVPLSLVADTLLLPTQAYQEWKHPRPHMDLWRTEAEQKAADKSPNDSSTSELFAPAGSSLADPKSADRTARSSTGATRS